MASFVLKFRHLYREILHLIRRHILGRNLRVHLLRMAGAKVGKGVTLAQEVMVFDGGHTELLTIEDEVGIGPFAIILIHSSRTSSHLYSLYPTTNRPVIIRKGASIGARVTILGGLTIGEHALVAAGSVVTRDVPPFTLSAGIPASVKKELPRPSTEYAPGGTTDA